MARDAILKTKIRPPLPRCNGVVRERLLQSLTQALDGRLTVVSAPAGFGKTTLLSQWAQRVAASVAWFSLDETDNDLMKFWRYLLQAVAPYADAGRIERVEPLLALYPNVTIEAVVDALLYALEDAPAPIVIVLDDFHLIREPAIVASLSYAIDRLPDRVHLAIASRTELPMAAAKWRARGQRLDLTAKQLSFTAEEAGRFCRDSAGLSLSDERIGQLMRWTEGWAASLQLLSMTLSEQTNHDRFFARFSGADRNIIQYLFEEVYALLPEALQRFLLRTSVLFRFDAAACDALVGEAGSERRLDELQRRNLFLTPIDEAGDWFRYHHLFALFLQTQLRQRDPAAWADCHRTAALHYAGRDYMDAAIEHAVAARDDALIMDLLGRHMFALLRQGEWRTLQRWIGAAAEQALPMPLRLMHAFSLILTGDFELAEQALTRAERAAEALEGEEARREAQSGLFFVKINLAFTTGNYEQWYKYADQLPDRLPESPLFYHLNYNTNEPLVRRTAFGLRGVQPSGIEAISRRILGILDAHGWGRSLFSQYILQTVAEGFYEWNRLEDSLEAVRRIEPEARRLGIAGLLVPNRIAAAQLMWAAGRKDAAFAIVEEALALATDAGDPTDWTRPLRAFEACLHLRDGNLSRAERILATLGIASQDKPSLLRTTEYVALARQLGARRKEKDALQLLDSLMKLSRREGSVIGMAEIAALQALLEAQRGQRTAAFERLQEALALGEPNGYARTFLDEGEPMRSLLQQFKRRLDKTAGSAPTAGAGYVERLLAQFPDSRRPSSRREPEGPAGLVEPLTAKETAVLAEAIGGAGNRDIAERLHLAEGTVKVYLSRIYAKLGVSSRVQALRRAEELRLLE